MVPQEPPADLLRRAATRLDEFDRAATPPPWRYIGRNQIKTPGINVDEANWGGIDDDGKLLTDYQLVCLADSGAWREADAALVATTRGIVGAAAELLRGTADRWEADNILDRPESGELQPSYPEAWWCGSCQGAIDSPDYPGDDQRCTCGRWTESVQLARAVLGEEEV